MRKLVLWLAVIAVVATFGSALAGEAAAKPNDPPKEAAELAPEPEGDANEVVAKVDEIDITRGELNQTRRLMSLTQRSGPLPNNEQILEQLINRALWSRHFNKKALRPSGAEMQQAIKNLDANLRSKNSSYQRFLLQRGLTVEEHAGMLSYEIAMRKLVNDIAEKITEKDIKAEYDAHPEFYDGSRVHIYQIFIDTSTVGADKAKLAEAKKKAEDIHAKLLAGKDFEKLAKDSSDGAAAQRGGDRGWFRRKGPDVDEELLGNAWTLKAGELTKPIKGIRGWHILKITEREPAYLTYFGSKRGIRQELTRSRLEALLEDLKAAAKIERLL